MAKHRSYSIEFNRGAVQGAVQPGVTVARRFTSDMRFVYEERMRAQTTQLFAWFQAGLINPVVDRAYPLAEFQSAMSDALSRRAIGRIAVVRGPSSP